MENKHCITHNKMFLTKLVICDLNLEGGMNLHFAHRLGTVNIHAKLHKNPSKCLKDTYVCKFKKNSGL